MKQNTDRLDKALAHMGIGTRRQVKTFIKTKRIQVNGVVITNSETKVSYEDRISFDGEILDRKEFYYIMIYKPVGCVTSTDDPRDKTVMEYLSERQQNMELFPIGRLDKDTEGLLVITNDGKLGHRLTSPKHNIWKTYYAEVKGKLEESDIKSFETGVQIDDGYICLPAELEIQESGESSKAIVKIREGKFRQIRRMFLALGKEVSFLKRLKMGDLHLDKTLKPGESRDLTEEEIQILINS
jgi:16S rRNA pseudouridine516 synthase